MRLITTMNVPVRGAVRMATCHEETTRSRALPET
jgi:hypothetical protein